jgi:chitinase
LTLPISGARGAEDAVKPVVLGYFASWRPLAVADLPADRLTHVCFAFAGIEDGEIAMRVHDKAASSTQQIDAIPPKIAEQFSQFSTLKQKHPHLRTLISIGGWGGSEHFSDTALTDASRKKFATSCAAFVKRHGFDGVDIDWEYPVSGGPDPKAGRPEDKHNYSLLLAELRRVLDEQGKTDGKHYLVTTATPAPPQHAANMELDQVAAACDYINLMTYDIAGPWSELSSFNAPLFSPGKEQPISDDSAVRNYLAAGVPSGKLVLGVPFYGKAFGDVKNVNNGLFQPHDHKTHRTIDGDEFTYRTIAGKILTDAEVQRFWHDVAKVPWLYDAKNQLMITYDDPQSLRLKANYARDNHLAGVMFWELSQDDPQGSLLKALHEGLK